MVELYTAVLAYSEKVIITSREPYLPLADGGALRDESGLHTAAWLMWLWW